MKTLLLSLLLLIPATSHADYYVVYLRYKSCGVMRTATYIRKTLPAARMVQDTFRKIPKYKNCWIKVVRER